MAVRQQFFEGEAQFTFRLKPLAACVKLAVAGGVLMAVATPVAAELPVPSAVWNSMGGASREVIGNTMNIKQQTDRVILNWDKFNVGKENTVNFKQPGASSIALNKIGGQDASRILGTVNANGQLYLVNKNGFVFGKDAKVDVHGMVTSTLDISEQTFKDGITKVAGIDKRAALEGNGDFYQKNPDGSFKLDEQGKKIPIKIEIEQGAKIKAEEGGRIMVIAPTIENHGEVEASGGQVLMAAATDKVYLQEAPTDGKADSDVRGLLVEVKTGGKVENLGKISANRGNVTLMGFAVNQKGRVSATTATNANGSIRLLAREGGSAELIGGDVVLRPSTTTRSADKGDNLGTSAKVELSETSKTEILPEAEFIEETRPVPNGEPIKVTVEKTAIDGQEQPLSRVEISGNKVHLKGGSQVVATGGKVQITASQSPANPVADNRAANNSRILIDSGAKIDVSGSDDVVKTMESNVIAVELRNFELKDAPLQKDGKLKGKEVNIDIRQGTPLTDIQPTVKGIKRTVAERLSKGGEIVLQSEGDVITEQGAILDISGGQIAFKDGIISTTKLISEGRVVDISEADPLLKYDGFSGEVREKSQKWGSSKTWKINGPFGEGRFEKGYVEGKDAGSIKIKANRVVNDGQIKAQVVNGRYQRQLEDQAKGGSLEVNTGFSFENVQAVEFSGSANPALDMGLDDELPNAAAEILRVEADKLYDSGLQSAVFNSNGKITIADNADVKLVDGGSLKLKGGSIVVDGDIHGAGASVDLQTKLVHGKANLDGDIVVADGSTIDLQGQWVNDLRRPDNLAGKSLAIDGGSFSAKVGGSVNGNLSLQQGSVIDVSGGGQVDSEGGVNAGKGGSISLIAEPSDDNVGANIDMLGQMRAYGLNQGGKFVARANQVNIGGQSVDNSGEGLKPLNIGTDFFNQGGFAEFDIGANLNGLTIADGAVIRLQQQNRQLNADYLKHGNQLGIENFSQVVSLPDVVRKPSSLKLSSDHAAGSNAASQLNMAESARIEADSGSSITLESDSSMVVDGQIIAHGGKVALDLVSDKSSTDPQYQASQGVWLGKHALLDVSGDAEFTLDDMGRRIGSVLDGGKVAITARRGFLVTQEGSQIDVSGGQAMLDVPVKNAGSQGADYRLQQVGSHGGNIHMTAAEGAFIAGDMLAKPGASAMGGTGGGKLTLSLQTDQRNDPNADVGSTFPAGPRSVLISQQPNLPLQPGFSQAGDALPNSLNGKAYLSVDQIERGGFSSLELAATGETGEIRFLGDIDLQLANRVALDAVNVGWQRQSVSDVGKVSLQSAYASIGSDVIRRPLATPTGGDGQLQVDAGLIDLVGGTNTTGFKSVDLTAKQDIRLKGIRVDNRELDFVGQFKTYSNLNLTAAQIYPTALTNFTLAVAGDANGKITINGNGEVAKPILSAMGKLSIDAPYIEQNGTIKAPLGEINLKAGKSVVFGANSLTSVSAAGQIVPLGVTQGGMEWMLPLAGTGNNLNVVDPNIKESDTQIKAIFEAPKKAINVVADKIERQQGAVVDLSGGGDLLAYEFIKGDGGSQDVLASEQVFAVMPGFDGYAPFDPKAFPESGLKVGDSVYLGGGSGLAAGNYALLPARYALLPGAFLVTPNSGTVQVAGNARRRVDGAPIVAGYRTVAGTDIHDQNWSDFVVETGSVARIRSEYNLSYASQFFADRAIGKELAIPRLPQDAGQLVLNAKSTLQLPTVKADVASGGRGGLVDIVSDKLAIGPTAAQDDIELLASDIAAFKVDSLLLGAVRSFDNVTGHIKLDVKAKSVTVGENAAVKAPELLLAATDKVEVQAGARIEAGGKVSESGDTVLETSGDGALLRASTGKQATLIRQGTSGAKGDLLVADSAVIAAGSGSVLLDATRSNRMDGDLQLDGGSLNIGAELINLGETSGVVAGLSLDNQRLSQLDVAQLVLTSRGMVNLYGELPANNAKGQPFKFGDLVIDAKGLAGKNNNGKTTILKADKLTLTNSNVGGSYVNGDGTGELNIKTQQLSLGKGSYRLSGFSTASIDADQQIVGRGEGRLSAFGHLHLNTPRMTAEHGAKTTIDLAGYALTIDQKTSAARGNADGGIAAQLLLEANAIDLNTALVYQSGLVALSALTQDVTLGKKALIDVSSVVVDAGLSKPVAVDAGSIALSAKQNVTAESGSRMLLNADGGAAAGELAVSAGGKVELNGSLQAGATSKAQAGRIVVDSGSSIAAADFTGWWQKIAAAGFSGGIDFRVRQGDMAVAGDQSLVANSIKLSADGGKITVDGKLDTSGADGGSIDLAAEDAVTLNAGAELNATATAANGKGGKVMLSALDRDNDGAGIDIKSGALIKVGGNGSGQEGEAILRADRKDTDSNGVADVDIRPIAPNTISGDSNVALEAWRSYTAASVNQTLQNTIGQHNQQYMDGIAAHDVAAARFGNGFSITPGVEVRSATDLTIANAWDLSGWRYGADGVPGVLSLRAAGNVLVNQSISDGFISGQLDTVFGAFAVSDFLQSGASWSLNLLAGADLQAADRMRLLPAPGLTSLATNGDVKLGNDVKLRTGTGDIAVHAARDIVYGNANSVIYTAGRPDEANRWGSGGELLAAYFYAEYPLDGGDISLQAGRNIDAKPSEQLLSDALVRTGSWSRADDHSGERPTAWGVALGVSETSNYLANHQQSVAAFGGGKVSVKAGGNINDLSVVVPTSGKAVGQKAQPDDPGSLEFVSNVVEVAGGGTLEVNAGGDVAGGVFYVDGGTADLRAGGSFKAGNNQGLKPILALGDSQLSVKAGKDMAIEAVIDPMFATFAAPADVEGIQNSFFRYSAESAVKLTALSGNISLENDPLRLNTATNSQLKNTAALVYPASLQATALNGNLSINKGFALFPAPRGNLDLFAHGDLTGNASINLSDANPDLLPSMAYTLNAQGSELERVLTILDPYQNSSDLHAATPLHAGDSQPVLISTGNGSVGSRAGNLGFFLAKPAEVASGGDIIKTLFKVQHNAADDASVLHAGRDLNFPVSFNPLNGNIDQAEQGIEIAGPGQLTVMAGRHIALGASRGILSTGNQNNPALAEDGSDISVLAGLNQSGLDVAAFAKGFLGKNDHAEAKQLYQDRLLREMRTLSGDDNLSLSQAEQLLASLPTKDRQRIGGKLLSALQAAFVKEIKLASTNLAAAKTKQDQDIFELSMLATIETLFPGSTLLHGRDDYRIESGSGQLQVKAGTTAGFILDAIYKDQQDRASQGNISLFLSTIQTMDGGNVNLFAPTGGITVGLATADIGLEKAPDQMGVIVKQKGDANLLARNNIDVNIQRLVTLGGGDILGGSFEGDVDAGRSPQTALAAPPLKVSYDATGQVVLEVSPILSGGGIRTVGDGNINLFAPRGIIDAGEAGISGNNVTLTATAIVGADNIDVGGAGVGVPVAAAGGLAAGLTGVSNLAASVTQAVEAAADVGKNVADSIGKATATLGILVVELLGFGE